MASKFFGTLCGVVSLGVAAPFSGALALGVVSTPAFKPGEVIVKYKAGLRRDRAVMERVYGSADVVKVRRFRGIMKGLEKLTIGGGFSVESAVKALERDPAVEYAQPNYILRALPVADRSSCEQDPEAPGCVLTPPDSRPDRPAIRPEIATRPKLVLPEIADPKIKAASNLSRIGVEKAWAVAKGSARVIVAVIDTGVDYNHEDLGFNMWRNPKGAEDGLVGWDFVHDDNLPFDDSMHGTHCAGVIGAVGGNGKGLSGINQRVSIMALKFLDADGVGETAGAIKAIDYAIAHGAKILNNSWGGRDDDDNQGLLEAIKRAEKHGALFITAAGNDGANNDAGNEPIYPAAFNLPNMISVAATDNADRLAAFSNFGKKTVHLAAPGEAVLSTIPGNRYGRLSGTSIACPHVAGAAALLWSIHPEWTYKEVKARLIETADLAPTLAGKTISGGRLNVANAVAHDML